MTVIEKYFKNEEVIKDMIVRAHRNGACDSNGASIKRDGVFIAKPRSTSSVAKKFVYRDGKVVWLTTKQKE